MVRDGGSRALAGQRLRAQRSSEELGWLAARSCTPGCARRAAAVWLWLGFGIAQPLWRLFLQAARKEERRRWL